MKISIITINYNDTAGLEKTLKSIVPKKTAEVELIVIDGASKDTSPDVIQHYKEQIDFWISEPDKGIYNAMNKGIEQAKGEYVLFINSGDALQSTANFESIAKHLDSGEDLIYFSLEFLDDNTGFHLIKQYSDQLDFKYFSSDALPHPASFIKKDLFDRFGYYREDLTIVSDWAFFLDIIVKHNCSYKRVDESFSTFWLDGISSQAKNVSVIRSEQAKHIEENYPVYYTIYQDWWNRGNELEKIKHSKSIKRFKKLGILKWI